MADEQPTSPVIKKQETFDFPEAMRRVISGKRITRVEWKDENEFGVFKDNFLMLHTKGEFHTWTVSDGDLLAKDWTELNSLN